jgi:raffinose/stachyose/melibiose transport system permease protein
MTDTAPPIDAASAPTSGRSLGVRTKTYLYAALLIVAAVVLVPLITTALGGFKTLGDLRANAFGLPQTWMVSNYTDILVSQRYWLQMGNSLLIAGLTVFLVLTHLAAVYPHT